MTKREKLVGALLTLGVFPLYAAFLSKAYVFEGLIRAMPIETGRWGYLFPGNYLLYGPLGLIFHAFLHLFGFYPLAVVSLQLMDALLGALGVGMFYLTLRKLGGDYQASLCGSAILAFSFGYWLWSTDAEDYILSTFLLIINFHFLVRYALREKVDPVLLGALYGLAILGHIVNVIFGAVGLWVLICVHGKAWLKPALRMASAAFCVAAIPYAAVLAFIQKPAHLRDALIWFEGSAGVGNGVINLGGGFSVAKFVTWMKTSVHLLFSFRPPYENPPAWGSAPFFLYVAGGLMACSIVLLVKNLPRLYARSPAVVGGCGIWLAAYALIFTRWQPQTGVYRVSDLVPFSVLLFLGVQEAMTSRWGRGAIIALAVCLAVGNLGAEIYPRSFASNNPHLMRMVFLKTHTAEGDWITGDGGQDEIYIPYFAQRRPIVIQRYRENPRQLTGLIDSLLARGQRVFATSRVLEEIFWKEFFRGYKLELKGREAGGFALYRVEKAAF